MSRLIFVAVALAVAGLASLASFHSGFLQGKMLAEGVLKPTGVIVLRGGGMCESYLDGGSVRIDFRHPYKAQFVTAVWELPISAK